MPKPRVVKHKPHTLKAKKVPLIPIPIRKIPKNLANTVPLFSTSPIPKTTSKESYKEGAGNQEGIQLNQKNMVPLYRTEEMLIDLVHDEDPYPKNMEKKKRDRKRKTEKHMPIDKDEEEIVDD